jgi:gamma-glutamylcysteine synthetase
MLFAWSFSAQSVVRPGRPLRARLSSLSEILFWLQAEHMLELYYGPWKESVDPIYSEEFTY